MSKKIDYTITKDHWSEKIDWKSVKIEKDDHWAETCWNDTYSDETTAHDHCKHCKKLLDIAFEHCANSD
jgi:hypothetical protein